MDDIRKRAAGLQVEFSSIATLRACHDGVARVQSDFDIKEQALLSPSDRAIIKNAISYLSPEAEQCTIGNAITIFILFFTALYDEPFPGYHDDELQSKLDLSSFVGVIRESQLAAASVVSGVIVAAYARNTGSSISQWELGDVNTSNAFKLVALRLREDNVAKVRHCTQKAAIASHAKHNDNKRTARDWYAAHSTMTKDAAAEKMAKDGIVHASFRTIRGYLTGQ